LFYGYKYILKSRFYILLLIKQRGLLKLLFGHFWPTVCRPGSPNVRQEFPLNVVF